MAGLAKLQQHTDALGKDEDNLARLTSVCLAFHSPDTRRAPRVGDACRSLLQFMVEEEPFVMWVGGQLLDLQGKGGIRKSFVTSNSCLLLLGSMKEENYDRMHLEKDFLGYRSTNYLSSLVPSSLTKILHSTEENFFDFTTPSNNGSPPCRHQSFQDQSVLTASTSSLPMHSPHTVRCILIALCVYQL